VPRRVAGSNREPDALIGAERVSSEMNREGEAAVDDLSGAGPAATCADPDDGCDKTDDHDGDR